MALELKITDVQEAHKRLTPTQPQQVDAPQPVDAASTPSSCDTLRNQYESDKSHERWEKVADGIAHAPGPFLQFAGVLLLIGGAFYIITTVLTEIVKFAATIVSSTVLSVKNQLDQNLYAHNSFGHALCDNFTQKAAPLAQHVHSQGNTIEASVALEFCKARETTEAEFRNKEGFTAKVFRLLAPSTWMQMRQTSDQVCADLLEKKGPEGLFYSAFTVKPGVLFVGNACYYRSRVAEELTQITSKRYYLEDVTPKAMNCLIEIATALDEIGLTLDSYLINSDLLKDYAAPCGITPSTSSEVSA